MFVLIKEKQYDLFKSMQFRLNLLAFQLKILFYKFLAYMYYPYSLKFYIISEYYDI